MRTGFAIVPLAVLSACAGGSPPVTPGEVGAITWTKFLVTDRGSYAFDKAGVVRRGDHVLVRWKVAWKSGATTLYPIDLDCRAHTYTELGTTVIDADGKSQAVPKAELWVDHRIEGGDSMDTFLTLICK